MKKIILFFILMLIGTQLNFSSAVTNEWIDVGLLYGNNIQSSVRLSSDSGFLFGEAQGLEFNTWLDLSLFKELTLYKAGYYVYNSQGMALLDENPMNYSQIKGGYALAYGNAYNDFNDAYETYIVLKAIDDQFYIHFGEDVQILYGHYLSKLDAETAIKALSEKIKEHDFTVYMPSASRLVVYNGESPVLSTNTSDGNLGFKSDVFSYNGVQYRNTALVKRLKTSDFSLINRLSLSEYLYGVVPREVFPSWHEEALKAQAVAARNYALLNKGKFSQFGFDVCATVNSQVYGGFSAEHERTNRAVDATQSKVLYYENTLAQCFYHSNSGGFTEFASNVWLNDLPHIRAVADPFSMSAPGTNWSATLSIKEIERVLKHSGYDIGKLESIQIKERTLSGRVSKMVFSGSTGEAVLNKTTPRSLFGTSLFKSMMFGFENKESSVGSLGQVVPTKRVSASGAFMKFENEHTIYMETDQKERFDLRDNRLNEVRVKTVEEIWYVNEEQVTFVGTGFGHGIGMSQWGAMKMAELGFTYDQILEHYFPGTKVSTFK